jgi:hypothetical protein
MPELLAPFIAKNGWLLSSTLVEFLEMPQCETTAVSQETTS